LSELRESLSQQTATAEILGVISSSPGDLQPVFGTIVDKATQICEAAFGCLGLFEEEALRFVAISGTAGQSDFFHRDPAPAWRLPLCGAVVAREADGSDK
jgi:hypothetical protein